MRFSILVLLALTTTATADGNRRTMLSAAGDATVVKRDGVTVEEKAKPVHLLVTLRNKKISIQTSGAHACVGLVGTVASPTSNTVKLVAQTCAGDKTIASVDGSIVIAGKRRAEARLTFHTIDKHVIEEVWKVRVSSRR